MHTSSSSGHYAAGPTAVIWHIWLLSGSFGGKRDVCIQHTAWQELLVASCLWAASDVRRSNKQQEA